MSEYEKCKLETGQTLKKRGFENYESMAEGMCKLWADDNGVERNFARDRANEEQTRSFAVGVGELTTVEDFVEFPVTAITSGLHDADGDQKVYIEPSIIHNSIGNFNELPIYYTHQRTPEDLIGKAVSPEVIETDDGKTAIKMLAKIDKNANERAREVLNKVDDGDITHVSIDWASNDVDVMGEPFATDIRPAEISFIDNEIEGDGTDLTISANKIKINSALVSGSSTSTGSFANVFVANRLSFNDHSGNATGEYLESDGTDLNINVGGSGDINVPANIGMTFGNDGEKIEGDGTDLTIAGAKINLTAESDVYIPQNIGLVFDANGSEKIESDDTDLTIGSGAKINLNATSDVHIPNDVGIVFGGASEKIEGDGTDLVISANNLTVDAAADIILDAGGNDTVIKSGGTTIASFKNASSDFVIVTDVDDKDIIFKGQDSTSEITALTLDMSAAGLANFNNDVVAFYSSDERLKDNVVKIGDPLMKLSELRGVEFDWNDNKEVFAGEHSYGVIAQEVEKVLPEIVTERGDGYKAVKYELIVPLLIESIKELHKKVEHIEKNCECLDK